MNETPVGISMESHTISTDKSTLSWSTLGGKNRHRLRHSTRSNLHDPSAEPVSVFSII